MEHTRYLVFTMKRTLRRVRRSSRLRVFSVGEGRGQHTWTIIVRWGTSHQDAAFRRHPHRILRGIVCVYGVKYTDRQHTKIHANTHSLFSLFTCMRLHYVRCTRKTERQATTPVREDKAGSSTKTCIRGKEGTDLPPNPPPLQLQPPRAAHSQHSPVEFLAASLPRSATGVSVAHKGWEGGEERRTTSGRGRKKENSGLGRGQGIGHQSTFVSMSHWPS